MMEEEMQYSAAPSPAQLRYSELVQRAIASNVQTLQYQPSNGSTFSFQGGTKSIRIPLSLPHGTFLDSRQSYLSFTVKVSATNTDSNSKNIYLDSSASSFIDVLSVQGPDGSILQRTDGYSESVAALKSVQSDFNHLKSFGCLTDGSSKSGVQTDGAKFTFAANSAEQHSQTFAIPLMSGILNAEKLIPAGFLSGAPLSLIIDLSSPVKALVAESGITASSITYQISEVLYSAQVVTLNAQDTALFTDMMQAMGGIQIHTLEVTQAGVNSLAPSASATRAARPNEGWRYTGVYIK